MSCKTCVENSVIVSLQNGSNPILINIDAINPDDVKSRSINLSCPNCRSALVESKDTEDATYFKCPSCQNTNFRIEKKKVSPKNGGINISFNGAMIGDVTIGDYNVKAVNYYSTPTPVATMSKEYIARRIRLSTKTATFENTHKLNELANEVMKIIDSDDEDLKATIRFYLKSKQSEPLADLLLKQNLSEDGLDKMGDIMLDYFD